MSPENDALLVDRYPRIFARRHTSSSQAAIAHYGFECGDGWFALIDALCAALQFDIERNGESQVVFSQVKEKLGRLEIYAERRVSDRQDGMIDMVSFLSLGVCEQCGLPGNRQTMSGWLATRCPQCAQSDDVRHD